MDTIGENYGGTRKHNLRVRANDCLHIYGLEQDRREHRLVPGVAISPVSGAVVQEHAGERIKQTSR